MNRQRKVIILLFMLSFNFLVYSQNSPVQVNMALLPPYTLRLSDYTEAGDNRLTVTVLLKSLEISTYQVRIRVIIEGTGFTISTSQNYFAPPVLIQGGLPEIFTGYDLATYFDPSNLDFNGISKEEYLRTKKLPEGYYRFSIEVVDYLRGNVVSNRASANAFIVLNDPPLINRPANTTKLTATDPQNIVFNWAPRHMGSPNSAFSTEYEFKLVEIWPSGRDPYEAMLTSPILYQTTTQSTTLLYDMMCPLLIPGKEYAFVVRALDVQRRDLFKNDGYSETFRFTYGEECKPPVNITAKGVTGGGAEISWKESPSNSAFNILYRVQGSQEWSDEHTLLTSNRVYGLPSNSVVEYKVDAECGSITSDYSEINTVKTLAGEETKFQCGAQDAVHEITNKNPKINLKVGDKFIAGGFIVKVTSLTINSDNSYTGECNVEIPYFSLAKIAHTFDKIKINELGEMYEGKLVSKFNPNSRFMVSIGHPPTEEEESDEGITNNNVAQNYTNLVINYDNDVIDTIFYNEEGNLVINMEDGTSEVIDSVSERKVIIEDSAGKEYYAENGTVVKNNSDNNTGTGSGTANNDPGSGTGESGTNSEFSAAFDKTEYQFFGSLQDPRSEIPVIKIKCNKDILPGYKIKLTDNDEDLQIYKEQIYDYAASVKFMYANVGAKTVSVSLLDENSVELYKTSISASFIDKTTDEIDFIMGEHSIGPIKVNFDVEKEKLSSEGNVINYSVSSISFSLDMKEYGFLSSQVNVHGAKLLYKYDKDQKKIIESGISYENRDGVDMGNLAMFSGKITKVILSVDRDGNLSGSVSFKVSVNEDIFYENYGILLKKGITGKLRFEYVAGTKFEGKFVFEELTNINIDLIMDRGSMKPFAALRRGKVNSDGLLTGVLEHYEDVQCVTRGFTLTYEEMALNVNYNLKTGDFAITGGEAAFKISQIKGTKGTLKFRLKATESNLLVNVDVSKTDLEIAGLTIKDIELTAVFNDKLEFVDAEGSMKLENKTEGNLVNVSYFRIEEGEIKEIEINGNIQFKGYSLEVVNCSFSSENGLDISALIKLGSENKFEVRSLKINNEGVISCSSISGTVEYGCVSASLDVGFSENKFQGSFDATLFNSRLQGSVLYGTTDKKPGAPGYLTEPRYAYGHFSITAKTSLPVFPGLKISKLGGQFGFNCNYELDKKPLKLYPQYESYVAGLSIGVGDISGIFNLDVDPAFVQFSNNGSTSIYIKSTLTVPANKPLFTGSADLALMYPSGQISGSISANIKVPDSKGWIFKTEGINSISFSKTSGNLTISTGQGLHAKILNEIDLTGKLDYSKNYDASGNVISTSGSISGNASFSFDKSFNASYFWDKFVIDGSLKIDFSSGVALNFDDNGSSGSLNGLLEIRPVATVTVLGGSGGIEGLLSTNANFNYNSTSANLNATGIIDLRCYAGEYEQTFHYNVEVNKTINF